MKIEEVKKLYYEQNCGIFATLLFSDISLININFYCTVKVLIAFVLVLRINKNFLTFLLSWWRSQDVGPSRRTFPILR